MILEVFSNKNDSVLSTKQIPSSPSTSEAVLLHLWSPVQSKAELAQLYHAEQESLMELFFGNSEPDTALRDSRPASPVCLCAVQDALPQEPGPSRNGGGCLHCLSTPVAGQDSFLEGLGFYSGGECSRRTGSPRRLRWPYSMQKDSWSWEARKHGSFSRAWVWGRYFFSDLWSISSSGGQNLLSIKKLPQSG